MESDFESSNSLGQSEFYNKSTIKAGKE